MATKAQKRAAGEARAKILAEESRLSGLRAQKDDQNRRAKKQQELMAAKAKKEAEEAERNRIKQNQLAIADVARVADTRTKHLEMREQMELEEQTSTLDVGAWDKIDLTRTTAVS